MLSEVFIFGDGVKTFLIKCKLHKLYVYNRERIPPLKYLTDNSGSSILLTNDAYNVFFFLTHKMYKEINN